MHKVTNDTQHTDILKQYRLVRSELTVSHTDDIILRGTIIVIPTVLQGEVLQLAHKGYQGIVKTNTLLRTKVWLPM